MLSVDYHETIMAAAGTQAEREPRSRGEGAPGGYIAVVEGSIPTGANGAYCTIGGESALDIAREVCGNAAATIAIGTCAAFGGIPAAAPNPTGALGVADAVPGVKNLINLSACPANVENLTALLVYYLTFKRWPPLDHYRRPLFAYGKSIHDNCERRAHFDAGQYVEAWGDAGHRAGYCLYKMGCKGPVDVPELSERPMERRHQLADRLRPSLHRLRRAGLLGHDDARSTSTCRASRASAPARTSTRSALCAVARRRRRVRRPRPDSDREARRRQGRTDHAEDASRRETQS